MEHQLDLFDVLYPTFKFDKTRPIRVFTSFSGIGFQEMGMDLAEIPFLVVGTSEIDKFSVKSYAAIHTDYLKVRDTYEFPDKEVMVEYLQEKNIGWNFSSNKHSITMSTNEETVKDFYLATILNNNLGDITKVKGSDLEKDIDLFTYSFPCQSLSKAGLGGGLSVETKSGLVYEVLRILHELKEENNLPKVLIMENVVDLVQAKFVDEWNKIALEMESEFSYKHYLQILNAKDYGIAQNRQRVFMVSILGDYNYNFPKGFELEYRLKDYLEDEVDDKYYLSDAMYGYLTSEHEKFSRKEVFERNIKGGEDDIAATITTRETNVPTSTFIDMDLVEEEPMIAASRGRYEDGVVKQKLEIGSSDTSNALTTVQKDNYLLIPEATTRGYKEAYEGDGVYINRAHQKRGVVQDGMIQTLKTSGNDVGVVVKVEENLIIEEILETCIELDERCDSFGDAEKERTKDLLQILWKEIGSEKIQQEIRRFNGFQEKDLLRKNVYEEGQVEGWELQTKQVNSERNCKHDREDNSKTKRLSNLWKCFESRYTPHRWELSEQQFKQLRSLVQELPHEVTSSERKVQSMWRTDERFGVLQQTLHSIQEIWRSPLPKKQKGLRIRKLTPIETGRLQGMNDDQIARQAEVTSNAQMYKQHGNGIVAQVIGLIIGMAYYDDENELREKVMANSHMWIKEKEGK